MTEDVFKDAINANPADMALRLVFADWLEEEGRCAEAAGHRWLAEQWKIPSGWGGELAFGGRYFYFLWDHACTPHALPIMCRPPSYIFYLSSYTTFGILSEAASLVGSALERKEI